MYEKLQPLLENLHCNFVETRNNISERASREGAVAMAAGMAGTAGTAGVAAGGRGGSG